MDSLEKFIRENRSKFDIHKPRHKVWNGIKRESTPVLYIRRLFVASVSIAAILISAVIIFDHVRQKNNMPAGIRNNEINETVMFYLQQYNNLYRSARPMLADQPVLEKELVNDMRLLDSILADIRKDLKDNIYNSEVIEALIQNYRTRVIILEEMLGILQNNQNNREKNDTRKL